MKDKIIQTVCKTWNVSQEEVLSRSKKQQLLFVRMMISQFLRKKTTLSTTEIGKLICRDHSTVLYYLKIYDSEYRFNDTFRNFADEIKEKLQDLQYQTPFVSELEEEFNEIRG